MLQTLFTGFIGGIFAWFVTDYIAKPLQRFYDLRREVNRCLVVYGNTAGRSAMGQDGKLVKLEPSLEEDAHLVQAQKAYRDLAGQLRAFANVDFYANEIVKWRGYDADAAASALLGYATELPIKGSGRARFHTDIQSLLRIRSDSTPQP